MNKKYFAIIVAMLVIIATLAACGKTQYDEDRIVVDRDGNTHILATNEDGETMQDEQGNIIEILTDDNGEEATDDKGNQQTQAITYPDFIENDGYVENQYMKVKIESGWEQIEDSFIIMLKNSSNGAQYDLNVEEGRTVEQVEEDYKTMVDAMKKTPAYVDPTSKTESVELGGIKMKKITIQYSINKDYLEEGDDESLIMYVYLHENDGVTYNFIATILPQHKDKVDFDKLIAAIEYK